MEKTETLASRLRAIKPDGPGVSICELEPDPAKASTRLRAMSNRMNSLTTMLRRSKAFPDTVKLGMASTATWSMTHEAMVLTVAVFATEADYEVSFDE